MNYDIDTRRAYRDVSKARVYRRQQTTGISWPRFTTWRDRVLVKKSLEKCYLTSKERVLDAPCGTGILAELLCNLPSRVFASDISREMIDFGLQAYGTFGVGGIVQADITQLPFAEGAFECIIVIGLMHRLPRDVRNQVLLSVGSVSSRFVIVSYSIDRPEQRIKQRLLKKIRRTYQSAPSPAPLKDVVREFSYYGFNVKQKFSVMPFFSAEVIFLLEKTI